jgi:hypothetical protein
MDIHLIKGVTNALVLTVRELRKLSTACQKQSNGNASQGVLYTSITVSCGLRRWRPVEEDNILAHTWGFQHYSFRQAGQCEGLRTVERAKVWLHA